MKQIKQRHAIRVGTGMMLIRHGCVLLGHRLDDGTWSMPGGKLDYGEDVLACALRETHEETGVRVTKGDVRLVSVEGRVMRNEHWVTIGFLARKFRGIARVMEPHKFSDWQWFRLDDLPSPLYTSSKAILNRYRLL